MRELFSIFLVENHALRKTIKNFEKLLEKTVVGWKFLAISLLKFDRFLKVRIYSERGHFGASSYAKKTQYRYYYSLKTKYILRSTSSIRSPFINSTNFVSIFIICRFYY